MATIKTDLICNLNQPVNVTYLHGNLFSQDNAGNTINVFVMDNGEPATIGGTVSANVIRSDGQTVAVSGAIEGNKAYVILPQACYAVPGVVHIIIKLTQSTTITTIAAIVANVYMSTTDAVIDPGTVIPSIQALMALIEEAVDSIPTDYTGLLHTIAADYSSSKTYKVGDYAWESGVLKRCIVPITAAETYTAAHWTNAVIGDDLTNLKSAIDNEYINNPPVANGSWNKNGTYTAVNPRRLRTDFIPVKVGDKIEIENGTLVHACAAWENTLSTETNIRSDNSWNANDEVIVSAVNGYYIVVFAKTDTTQNVSLSEFDGYIHLFSNEIYRNAEKIKQTNENVDELSEMIDLAITSVDVPIYTDSTVALTNTTGSVIANGTINTSGPYANNQYSQKIPVSEGDILTPIKTGDSAWFRFVCAYNGNSAVSSAGKNDSVLKYVVPQGIDGVIVSTPINQGITSVKHSQKTGTETKVYTKGQELGSINWHGSLSNGDSVELLPSNVRFNVVWNFTGHVSTMGKITIGIKIPNGTIKELCSVDSTYIYYRQSDGNIAREAHGLTISEDLQIKIESPFKVNELGGITICSDGTEYTLSATAYGTDMTGCPYLVSDGAVMTDCAFSWIPKDIDKPIWVFGDSWVSMYDTRWPYYMVRDGFTNTWMLNGFAGEDTDEAYESLENLLTIRKPDYIVWLLGMNNGDSSTAVNSVWKAIYDKLVQLCEDYSINLILYTVPNTPTINNNFKNAIVRASGYRYIDGAAAVGDDGEGNWFTNFEQSSSDHNHTSGRGARALYYRILADFPEIAGNGL